MRSCIRMGVYSVACVFVRACNRLRAYPIASVFACARIRWRVFACARTNRRAITPRAQKRRAFTPHVQKEARIRHTRDARDTYATRAKRRHCNSARPHKRVRVIHDQTYPVKSNCSILGGRNQVLGSERTTGAYAFAPLLSIRHNNLVPITKAPIFQPAKTNPTSPRNTLAATGTSLKTQLLTSNCSPRSVNLTRKG